jgi:hypothetical protein
MVQPRPASNSRVVLPACTRVDGPKRTGDGPGPPVPSKVTIIDPSAAGAARTPRAFRLASMTAPLNTERREYPFGFTVRELKV